MANVMVTDEDDRIHVLKGKQADTFRYYFRGHVYYRDKRNDGLIFRCKHKNRKGVECSAYFTVRSLTNFENQIPRLYGKHDETEIPDPYLILREEFDSEVLFLAQTTYDDYKILFDKVKIKPKYGPIADQLLFYSKYEKRMARARSERVIRIPNDLVEWEQMLQEYPPMKDSYRGLAIGEDDSHSLVFIHKSMLPALKECAQLFGDGTFETRISRPKSAQFFTIHLRKMDIGFPAIFVFMSHRTQECYDAMWRKIFEYAPELKDNVDTVMSDFERAQINSAKLNFPNATQSGCIFHYKQAIARYWESLGIPIEYEFILERTYAVAHLKSDDVEAGFNHVDSLITGVYDNNEVIGLKLLKFGRYLRRFWLPLKTVFTVFGHPIRSNSICEVFHLHWKKKVGKRPNPWKCLEILDQLMQSTAQDFDSVCKGYRLRASRSRDWQNIDNAIRDAERLYDNRGIGIVQFLKYIESLRKLAHARVLQQKEFANAPRVINENVEFDEADVSFIANNLEAVPGAGSNFERVIIVRRRRKNREIREGDSENEDAEDGGAPNRRRTRLESVDATPAAPRRRGRPPLRRNVEETAVVNAVSEDEDNEETVPRRRRRRVEPVRAPPTIPRRRGRPRRNVELNAQESEVEDVEVTLPNQLRTRQESIEASHAAPRRRVESVRNVGEIDVIRMQVQPTNENERCLSPMVPTENEGQSEVHTVFAEIHHVPTTSSSTDDVLLDFPSTVEPTDHFFDLNSEDISTSHEQSQTGAAASDNNEDIPMDDSTENLNPTLEIEVPEGPIHESPSNVAADSDIDIESFFAEDISTSNEQSQTGAVASDNNENIRMDNSTENINPTLEIEAHESPATVAADSDIDVESFFAPLVPPAQVPKRKNRSRGGKKHKCPVCFEAKQVHILRPCKHRCCALCLLSMSDTRCPLCRTIVETFLPPHLMPMDWHIRVQMDRRAFADNNT